MSNLVPWQIILTAALTDSEIVGVGAVVRAHLGRDATRSELTSARRAALRLAAAGNAVAVHLPAMGANPSSDRLLLAWPGADTSNLDRLRAATSSTRQPGHVGPSQVANTAAARAITLAVSDAAGAVGDIDVDQLAPTAAMTLAEELGEALLVLARYRQALRAQGVAKLHLG